jgi:hypothetical protein
VWNTTGGAYQTSQVPSYVTYQSASPQININDTASAANNKYWRITANTAALFFQTFSDNLGASNNSLHITRTGALSGNFGINNDTTVFSNVGVVSTYNSVATVGVGIPSFTGQVLNTGFSTTQTNQTILASSVASQYRIGYTLYESANGSGGTCSTNATVTPAITYTDPNTQTHVFTAGAISLKPTADAGTEGLNCAASTGSGGCEILRHVKTGTAITITYTFANGNCNTQPQATAKAYAEVVN